MSLEHFSRLSKSIRDAAEHADKEKAQKAATLVVDSVGVMSTTKRAARPADFAQATDFIGNAMKASREAKQADLRDGKKTGTEQPAKSLAELLTEAQDEE
jgi:Ca2+-dependent lipid-binding protein